MTEQEHVTKDLQRRQAYFAEAERLSHTGSFGWNVSTDKHLWSDETSVFLNSTHLLRVNALQDRWQ